VRWLSIVLKSTASPARLANTSSLHIIDGPPFPTEHYDDDHQDEGEDADDAVDDRAHIRPGSIHPGLAFFLRRLHGPLRTTRSELSAPSRTIAYAATQLLRPLF
jgi:hypothetical protein